MKKQINKRLCMIIFAAMLVSLLLNYLLQILQAQNTMRANSQELFWQINQVLVQNEKEVEQIKEDFAKNCLVNAKAAAYIVQNNPGIINNQDELEKIAELLQIDEFHIFDTQGNLYAGSQPKYFGLNFNSGEQMRFFLPMLEDRSLELCQEITPNTAEQKLMQYAAVWREDGEGIVQIGMEPHRVLEAMKRNELSYIFSIVTADKGAVICALDPETYQVLGATSSSYIDQNIETLGITREKVKDGEKGFHAVVDGRKSYCVFERNGSVILGRIVPYDSMYENVNRDSLMMSGYLLLLGLITVAAISRYLDHYILKSISAVNQKMRVITGGDLDTRVEVNTTPEFMELSDQINEMIGSLLDSTNKLSSVLDVVSMPVAAYEYRQNMKRVMATRRVAEILCLSQEEEKLLLSDCLLFEKRLEEIRFHVVDRKKEIYQLPGQAKRFIRIESIIYEKNMLGILMDVTNDVMERRDIERERDIDLLTELYNRRAFYRYLEEYFVPEPDFKQAVILLADSDQLKRVNDQYGHESGDRYLCGVAHILCTGPSENRIVARLGGDEFALIICADEREELVERIGIIREAMQDYTIKLSPGVDLTIRVSAGCAYYPEDGSDYRELIKLADKRMYQEKKEHKKINND